MKLWRELANKSVFAYFSGCVTVVEFVVLTLMEITGHSENNEFFSGEQPLKKTHTHTHTVLADFPCEIILNFILLWNLLAKTHKTI